jgi:phosphoglycerol transferase MdoB-like AlkP superfamily enzyme
MRVDHRLGKLAGLLTTVFVVFASPAAAGVPWDFEVAADVPVVWESGARVQLELTVTNRGAKPWNPAEGFALSYHWLDRSARVIHRDGVRSRFPEPIAPGETTKITATVEAPSGTGEFALQWDIVQEGVRWLSEVDPTPAIPIPIVLKYSHAFRVIRGQVPRWLAPGSEAVCRLVLQNDGTRTWLDDRQIALSYHWFGADGEIVAWDGLRSRLPKTVRPGDEVVVDAIVRAPMRSGRYRLQWDMVDEGVTWFSQRDPVPKRSRLVVVGALPVMGPAEWACATLLVSVAAVAALRRRRPGWMIAALSVGDVLWCAGSLVVKQAALLRDASQPASFSGWILMWAGVAAILLPLLLVRAGFRAWCCWVVAVVATIILFADHLFQRFFGDLLSFAMMKAGGQLTELRASVSSLLTTSDLWWGIDLIGGLVLVLVVRRLGATNSRPPMTIVAAILAVLLAGGLIQAARLGASKEIELRQVFRNLYLAREVGVLNFHLLDAGRELERRLIARRISEEAVDEVTDWFQRRAPLRAGKGPWFGIARELNLLMVQVESLQGFVLGLEIEGQEVTPFLNQWAQSAVVFDEITDQTAQGRSSDSELATQVSLIPPPSGAAAFRYGSNSFTGLASVLRDRGYSTLSAVAFDGAFWNRRVTHPAFGFGESLFAEDFEAGEVIGWGLNDRDFLRQMTRRLDMLTEPFCALLLTLSLHHPFDGFPEQHQLLELGERQGTALGNYLHMMHFFDGALERLITGLVSTGLADHTVVVLWGDHDAGLEWSSELAALVGRPHDAAGWYLSQRVPVVIRVPGELGPRGHSAIPGGHQDLAPTLLALMGVDPAPYAFVGRNLLGDPGGGPVVGEYQCWRDDDHLYLQGGGRLDQGQCIELLSMERVGVEACRRSFLDARRQVEISQLVLENDLQERIGARLQVRLSSPSP